MSGLRNQEEIKDSIALVPVYRSISTLFLVALAFCLISKGASLFDFGYSADTYTTFGRTSTNNSGQILSQGRPGFIALLWVMDILGLNGSYSNTIAVLFGFVAISAMSIALIRPLIDKHGPDPAVFIGVALAVSHPYLSEIFTYREALFPFAAAVLLGLIGYYLVDSSAWRFLGGTLLIVLSLSIYQIILNYLVLITAFSVLFSISLAHKGNWPKEKLAVTSRRMLAIVLACVLYLALYKLLTYTYGIESDPRAQFISMRDVPGRALTVLKTLWDVYSGRSLNGDYYRVWLTVIMVFMIVTMVFRKDTFSILMSLTALLIALFSVVGVLSVNYS